MSAEREHRSRTCIEWPFVEIGQIAEIIGGSTPSTKDAGNFDGDVPWLTPKDLSGIHDRVVVRGKRNLSLSGLLNCSAHLLPPGAVLLSTRAPIGYVAIAGAEIATNQGFRSLVLKEEACPGFVYYWLKDNTEELERHATGTTFRELSGSTLKRIRIPLPPLSEQRSIADVLGVLDDRIAVNRRMNETLEAMAQTLFQDWFIDFGPTRAKAKHQTPYLPLPLWNLFPNKLTNSKLGKIPEGWRLWRLDEIAEHQKGAVDPSREPETIFEHYSIPAYDAGCHPAMDEGASIKSNKSRIPQHAVLLSKLNPDISRVWVPDDPGDAVQVASTEFLAYVPREGFGRGLLSALFRSPSFREVLQGMVTGTSRSHQRVPPKALNTVECLVGKPEHFSAFESFAGAALRRQMRNRMEIRTLTALRNTLLPKLISGNIRIHKTNHRTGKAP